MTPEEEKLRERWESIPLAFAELEASAVWEYLINPNDPFDFVRLIFESDHINCQIEVGNPFGTQLFFDTTKYIVGLVDTHGGRLSMYAYAVPECGEEVFIKSVSYGK